MESSQHQGCVMLPLTLALTARRAYSQEHATLKRFAIQVSVVPRRNAQRCCCFSSCGTDGECGSGKIMRTSLRRGVTPAASCTAIATVGIVSSFRLVGNAVEKPRNEPLTSDTVNRDQRTTRASTVSAQAKTNRSPSTIRVMSLIHATGV